MSSRLSIGRVQDDETAPKDAMELEEEEAMELTEEEDEGESGVVVVALLLEAAMDMQGRKDRWKQWS